MIVVYPWSRFANNNWPSLVSGIAIFGSERWSHYSGFHIITTFVADCCLITNSNFPFQMFSVNTKPTNAVSWDCQNHVPGSQQLFVTNNSFCLSFQILATVTGIPIRWQLRKPHVINVIGGYSQFIRCVFFNATIFLL